MIIPVHHDGRYEIKASVEACEKSMHETDRLVIVLQESNTETSRKNHSQVVSHPSALRG